LVLVKGLVELHGGTVTARSEGTGKGAEFVVRLPALREAAADARVAQAASATTAAQRRVLVIEDDRDVAEALCAALAVGGHVTDVAHSGQVGVAKARGFVPDVVLCDIGLPGMDGYEVARRIRADASLRATRLVALSGYAQSGDVGKARAAGFDDHLAKPSSIDKVLAILTPQR
jgi:CheY-like chemotaxis protein